MDTLPENGHKWEEVIGYDMINKVMACTHCGTKAFLSFDSKWYLLLGIEPHQVFVEKLTNDTCSQVIMKKALQ